MDTERTARDKYLHDADLALADIDRALTPPFDIDDYVHHPTQWIAHIGDLSWWQDFVDGEISWKRATELAEAVTTYTLGEVLLWRDSAAECVFCWHCGGTPRRNDIGAPALGDDMCAGCREQVAALAAWSDTAKASTEADLVWGGCWAPDNTGGDDGPSVDGAYDRPSAYKDKFARIK